ncbi:hypothetical protein Hamer_G019441 [Homarus americanus]|uniref:Uncharacterized protein n=1 Tax=Homarus americanus TaxID=6706 RepID=A0A8J5JNM2_HOMAM|nr:hypothetical protein Hamer_G019441 [Homarus americanus]
MVTSVVVWVGVVVWAGVVICGAVTVSPISLSSLPVAVHTFSSTNDGENVDGRRRGRRYLPIRLLGRPPSTTQTPVMFAQASDSQYQYMPVKDDGTIYELDPCPAPSPPSGGGGGSNVFSLLTFSIVTANVLINAVSNVNNNNNRNNNNNENNNNGNINNENVSNNLDTNNNDNTIMTGRALGNTTSSCVCRGQRRRRGAIENIPKEARKTGEMTSKETPHRNRSDRSIPTVEKPRKTPTEGLNLTIEAPNKHITHGSTTHEREAAWAKQWAVWVKVCVPWVVCETSRAAPHTTGLASFTTRFSGLASGLLGLRHIPTQLLEEARARGARGESCTQVFPCPPLARDFEMFAW